jgi:TetR/AcrR family acrAB operon transcriptional repressor
LSVFSRQGYKSARLQDIATEADVIRGAIYHHFGNKAGLFMTLIQEAIQTSSNIVPRAIHEGGTFLEIMERIMVRGFELLETDVQVRQTMRLYLFHTEVDDELSMFGIFLKEQAVGTVKNAAQFMQMGITQGVLRQDLDVETAARAFVAFQNGVIHLWLLAPEAFSIREQASALARAFLHGLVHRERV